MAQETLVLKLGPEEQRQLRDRLGAGAFEHRAVPHAHFSVRGEGVVATLYRSGKLVVQGADPGAFTLRYLDRAPEPAAPAGGLPALPADRPLVGSDEAGKGDWFGPLVVAALRLPPEEREALRGSGVADSKTLDDTRIRRLAPALMERYEHAVEVMEPETYNREHARVGNLNLMLADLHGRAIRRLGRAGDVVLVDRFGPEKLVAERVAGCELELHQVPRAEREPAVAAASVLARARFVEELERLSEAFAVDLHKGAGAPTDRAGRRFVALHGREALGSVAKLHFKNTGKLGGRRG